VKISTILLFFCLTISTIAQIFAQVPPKRSNPFDASLDGQGQEKDTWFKIVRMKRCPIKACQTKMVHTHDGRKFRGREKWRLNQNPKTGELVRSPVTDGGKKKKPDNVKKKHEYQKEFTLPEKTN
jgi:hypothetical protein